MFKDKILMTTGGTGSFGNAILEKFIHSEIKEIRIFSRDEKKQDDMRHHYQVNYPDFSDKLKFYNIYEKIGCMSQANVNYLLHHNEYIPSAEVEIFPNCIDVKDKKIEVNRDKV